jgi:hypothetical protein
LYATRTLGREFFAGFWSLLFGGQTDLKYDFEIQNPVHSALATPIYRRWKVEQTHIEICKQHRRRRRR